VEEDGVGMRVKTELQRISSAVDGYAKTIKKRLVQKYKEGYCGWDGDYSTAKLCNEIYNDAEFIFSGRGSIDGDCKAAVDIGGRGMMLWYRRKKVRSCRLKPS
jgi:hypothetical protein